MRPAQDNDLLTIDYRVFVDDEEVEAMGASDRPASLGTDSLMEEVEAGLLGTQPGEEKKVDVAFPEDHPNEAVAGKTATFVITIKELKERSLPELDDEFAKDVGDFETLLELRLKTREQLEAMAKTHEDAALKEALIDKLIERNPLEVPPTLVLQEQQQTLYRAATYSYMNQVPFNAEAMAEPAARSAERRVKAAILLGAVAKQESIEFLPEDLEVRYAEIAEATGRHVAKVKAEYAERRGQLENELLEEKLIGHLRSIAKIEKKPADEIAKAAESEDDQVS